MALPAVVKILKRLTCSDFGGGANCRPADLSSAIDYDKVQSYTSSIQNVLDIFPGTERLVSCELVKAGFADIVGNQCAPLRRGARVLLRPHASAPSTQPSMHAAHLRYAPQRSQRLARGRESERARGSFAHGTALALLGCPRAPALRIH